MDIQQQEKESLAAYVHWFKTEQNAVSANDTAIIRIFVKGLWNPHCLAARIYEKDPQTLKDAITEVGKLNAAQQLTTTILLSSMVNMMSNEDDQCFQCQEPGHFAQHCPDIRCHECEECGHIVIDCPHKIPPGGTPAQHHKVHRNATPGQALGTTKKIKKGETGPDHSPGIADITAPAITTCTEAALDHNKGMGTATIEAAQGDPIQHTQATVTEPAMTHHTNHTTDHSITAAHLVTILRATVGHIHAHPTNH